jgi:hypothetical protein
VEAGREGPVARVAYPSSLMYAVSQDRSRSRHRADFRVRCLSKNRGPREQLLRCGGSITPPAPKPGGESASTRCRARSASWPAKRATGRSPLRKRWVKHSSKIPPSPGGAKEPILATILGRHARMAARTFAIAPQPLVVISFAPNGARAVWWGRILPCAMGYDLPPTSRAYFINQLLTQDSRGFGFSAATTRTPGKRLLRLLSTAGALKSIETGGVVDEYLFAHRRFRRPNRQLV